MSNALRLVASAGGGESEPLARGDWRETRAMAHRVSSPEFVGRAEELGVLAETYARVAAGDPATLAAGAHRAPATVAGTSGTLLRSTGGGA